MAESNATFTIPSITSESEANTLEDELEETDGVMGATIDPESGDTEVRYDEDLISEERVKNTVRDAGYDVE